MTAVVSTAVYNAFPLCKIKNHSQVQKQEKEFLRHLYKRTWASFVHIEEQPERYL